MMKKGIIAFILISILTVCLVLFSCGDDDGEIILKGTNWEYEADFMGEKTLASRIEFYSDTEYREINYKKDAVDEGTYVLEDNKVTLTSSDEYLNATEGTIKGRKMTIIISNSSIFFEIGEELVYNKK